MDKKEILEKLKKGEKKTYYHQFIRTGLCIQWCIFKL